jgi:REP element-mobilizing transposase RayT
MGLPPRNSNEDNPVKELPQRKRPASGVIETTDGPTIVFDTVCTQGRNAWLATNSMHRLLLEVWQAAGAWLVGRYVIMPEHIHYFATPGDLPVPFENWVRYWKSQFTQRHRQTYGDGHATHWQANDWDTRIRNATVYEEKWEYVRMNPVRRGLVASPEEWPYCGEMHEMRWE